MRRLAEARRDAPSLRRRSQSLSLRVKIAGFRGNVRVRATGLDQRSAGSATVPWAYLRLPPFPQVAVRVLQLANNENVQLHQLCDLISSDPAFASEVLTVSNSLLYAPRYPSTTILQAVAVLGANTLQGMCVTVGVRAYLGKTMSYPAMRNLWRHNLACAIIAGRHCECWIDRQRHRVHRGHSARRWAHGAGGDSAQGVCGAA